MRIILRGPFIEWLHNWIFSYDMPVHEEITIRLRNLRLYHDSNV